MLLTRKELEYLYHIHQLVYCIQLKLSHIVYDSKQLLTKLRKQEINFLLSTNLCLGTNPRISPYVYSMIPDQNSCCFWVSFYLFCIEQRKIVKNQCNLNSAIYRIYYLKCISLLLFYEKRSTTHGRIIQFTQLITYWILDL